jgi:hypothetical protein
MDYCESKPRKTLAAFIDFYYIPMAVGLILGITISIVRINFVKPVFSILLLAVDVAAVAIYHASLSDRMKIMTLGEMIAGRISEAEEKRWINPYCRNRTGIYLFVFAVLVLYGNTFDSLFYGAVLPLSTTIGKGIGILLVSVGFVLLGRGKINGILIPIAILLVGGVLAFKQGTSTPSAIIAAATFGVIAIVGIIVWIIYRRLRAVQ